MAEVKIEVNHNRCVGAQLCIYFLPGVFTLNADGQSTVIDVATADAATIIQTAEQCPQCAITITDSSTGAVLFPPADLGF